MRSRLDELLDHDADWLLRRNTARSSAGIEVLGWPRRFRRPSATEVYRVKIEKRMNRESVARGGVPKFVGRTARRRKSGIFDSRNTLAVRWRV